MSNSTRIASLLGSTLVALATTEWKEKRGHSK